jgi:hypothetical protein
MVRKGLLLCWLCLPVGAQLLPQFGQERVGISTVTALKLLGSPRSAALVNATVAMPDGVQVWLNPALAAELAPDYAFGVFSQRLVADIWYHALSLGGHLWRQGTWVLGVAGMVVPPIEETTEFRPYGTGRQIRFGHWNAGLTYGHRFTEQFAAGVSLRYVREQWSEARLEGLVWDAGTLYWTGIGSVRLAVSVSHFGLPLRASGSVATFRAGDFLAGQRSDFQGFAPPTVFRIGVAGEVLQSERQRWSWMAAVEHPSDQAESYALASEYAVRFSAAFPAELMLRAGLRAPAAERWALGVGCRIPVAPFLLQVDYAFSLLTPAGGLHRIGCSVEPLVLP